MNTYAGLLLSLAACGAPDAPAGIEEQALAAPAAASRGQAKPRFRLVPPSESGLQFKNQLRRENRYTYLTNGAGLAVGDYDGDGMLDAYLVSQDGPNKLFRQVGPLKFADVTDPAGEVHGGDAWGCGASFADVDGDGDLDLYVCNMEAKNLLYENQGKGQFKDVSQSAGPFPGGWAWGGGFLDVDNDGHLDLHTPNGFLSGRAYNDT